MRFVPPACILTIPLPGLRESIETGDGWLAAEQAVAVREVLEAAAAHLRKLHTIPRIEILAIKVLFFGVLPEITGRRQEWIELREGTRLAELWGEYVKRFPKLETLSAALMTSVNQEFVDRSQLLRDGDEVAFLPPVSGGVDDLFLLTPEAIHTAALVQRVKAPPDGAVVAFEGIVRNHSRGKQTQYLEYEAYEPMALKKMREIGAEIHQQFPIDAIAMVHRLGKLAIGETSVAIVLSSPHRKAAFAACQHGIDRLKQIVPIWKKEFFADGAVWAEGEGQRRVLVETRSHDP